MVSGERTRPVPPAATLAAVWPLATRYGITRLANITGLDVVGIPVVQAIRPNAISNAVAQGKGLDLDAAKVAALMEAVETWHAERIERPLRYGCAAELSRTLPLADIDRLPRVAGNRFHAHLDMLWIEGADVATGEPLWLPYELVHARFKTPYPPGSGCFPMSTNGLASGNDRGEAMLQGLCEVIERDATTLFEMSAPGHSDRRLDLDSVDAVSCRLAIDRLEQAGLQVAVWDVTSDLGVPVFACQILERTDGPGLMTAPAEGVGCHPDTAVALLRALVEAAQSRLAIISGARDDVPQRAYQGQTEENSVAAWRHRLDRESGTRRFPSLASLHVDAPATGVDLVGARLAAAGLHQAIVIDLADSALPYAVVRVVVPGLEPVRGPGYLPGRRACRPAGAA